MGRGVTWVVLALAVGGAAYMLLGGGEESAPGGAGIGYDDEYVTGEDERKGPALHAAARERGTASPRDITRFSVRGRVQDAEGAAVPDVPVSVRHRGRARNPNDPSSWAVSTDEQIRRLLDRFAKSEDEVHPVKARGRSGKDGAFHIALPEPAQYRVFAAPPPPSIATFASAHVHSKNPDADVVLTVLDGTPLHGRVLAEEDRPVSATLMGSWWSNEGGTHRAWASDAVATDPASGAFSFGAVPKGNLSFTVTLPGGRRVSGIAVETPHEGELVIRVSSTGGVVEGAVTDVAGAPVPGAVLALTTWRKKAEGETGGSTQIKTTTDGTGRYRIEDVPPGRVTTVQALAEGFLAYSEQPKSEAGESLIVEEGKPLTLDVKLSRGGTVFGRVLDKKDDTPIAGAGVQLLPARGGGISRPGSTMKTEADAQGRFRFERVGTGRYVALANARGYYLPEIANKRNDVFMPGGQSPQAPPSLTVVVTEEGVEVERDLRLKRGFAVTGRVVDSAERGVRGAEIRARNYGLNQLAWQWGIGGMPDEGLTKSGAGGRFEVPGLPPRADWVLYARKEGHAGTFSEPFAVSQEKAAPELTLKLRPGAVIRGRIVGADPAALATAQVGVWGNGSELSASRSFKKIGADGKFELSGIAPGDWTINVWMNGRSGAQKQIADLKAGEVREGIEIELATGVEVSGVVVDKDGKGVSGLQLNLQVFHSSGGWFNTRTDKEGRFKFEGVRKARVQLQTWGGAGQKQLGAPFQAPKTDVRVVYVRERVVSIQGEVFDPAGEPIPLAIVSIKAASDKRGNRRTYGGPMGAGSSEVVNGKFKQVVTGTGPYTVTITAARDASGNPLNLQPGTATVRNPAETVVIRLEGGLEISGTVTDERGKAVVGIKVTIGTQGVDTDENGAFTISGLKKGKHAVQVNPTGEWVRPSAQHVAAGTSGLRFELQAGLEIRGKAMDPEGKPIKQGYASGHWKKSGRVPSGSLGTQIQPDGSFVLRGIPDGASVTVQVQVWSQSGDTAWAPVVVEGVQPGTKDLVMRMGVGLDVEGVVLDPDGKPASGVFVHARSKDGKKHTGWMQVKDDGSFKLAGLEPMVYLVSVMRQDRGAAPDPVEVTPPATGVRITLPRTTSLAGRILGLSPADAPRFSVRVWGPDGNRLAGPVKAAGDGSWSFQSIREGGRVHVGAYAPGDERYARIGPIDAGRMDVVLRLKKGRSITGIVDKGAVAEKTSYGVRAVGEDGWRVNGTVKKDGTFEIKGLPPGRYKVSAWTYQAHYRAEVEGIQDGAKGVRVVLAPLPGH